MIKFKKNIKMDPVHRELLKSNFVELSKVINLKQIVPFLLEKRIFTEHMMEDVLAERTEVDQKHKLLLDLPRRGPDAFEKFVEILLETGHYNAALILEPNFKNDSSISQLSTFNNFTGGLDMSVREIGHTQPDNQGINQLRVKPATRWREGSDCYKMSSCPRGYCLIINNVDFQKLMDERYGSEGDARKLNMVFHEIGYEVTLKTDLTSQQIIDVVEAFSKKPEHEHVDSCVVIILSHGEYDIVYGTDAEEIRIEKILDCFNNESCPLLQGKPKMFFFQACRGMKFLQTGLLVEKECYNTFIEKYLHTQILILCSDRTIRISIVVIPLVLNNSGKQRNIDQLRTPALFIKDLQKCTPTAVINI
ncbi:caspase-2-like isoform X3 [Tachypleus tridentatus]|uniref:caspase-2-like isoform X3 n=1 Tax=Tachypleus tridentatus TaxID=6853 RepID=UPI003FD466A5